MTFKDHLEYFEKHRGRICKVFDSKDCYGCPLNRPSGCCINSKDVLTVYDIVKEWAEKNPEVTYRKDFKNKFPKTEEIFFENVCRCEIYGRPVETDEEGCPLNVTTCDECWNAPIE